MLDGEKSRRKRAFKKTLAGVFPKRAARCRSAQNAFESLRGLRHLLAGFLNFAQLFLNEADLLASTFELVGHGGLGLRSNLRADGCGVFHAVLEGLGDAGETVLHILRNGFELSGSGSVRGGDGLEIAAQFGHLRFDLSILFLILCALPTLPKGKKSEQRDNANQQRNHTFSPFTGNGTSTLLISVTK